MDDEEEEEGADDDVNDDGDNEDDDGVQPIPPFDAGGFVTSVPMLSQTFQAVDHNGMSLSEESEMGPLENSSCFFGIDDDVAVTAEDEVEEPEEEGEDNVSPVRWITSPDGASIQEVLVAFGGEEEDDGPLPPPPTPPAAAATLPLAPPSVGDMDSSHCLVLRPICRISWKLLSAARETSAFWHRADISM